MVRRAVLCWHYIEKGSMISTRLIEYCTVARSYVRAHTSAKLLASVSALAIGFGTNYLWMLIQDKLPIIGNTDNSFNGYWIATFHSVNVPNTTSLELLRIKRSGNDVMIYIENFNSGRPRLVYQLKGTGHIQGENMTSTYYYEDGSFPEVGALVLHLEGTDNGAGVQLVGQWVQSMNRSGQVTSAVPQAYLATACGIDTIRQIKQSIFGVTDFHNFDEINAYIKAGKCGT
jgi:hypothetical protein